MTSISAGTYISTGKKRRHIVCFNSGIFKYNR